MVLEIMLKRNESLKNITEGLSRANEAISKALNTTNRTMLLGALRKALRLENAVLSQLKPACQTDDSCSKEELSLMQVIYDVVVTGKNEQKWELNGLGMLSRNLSLRGRSGHH
ncbi:unnamed protein product [Nippostrongylus brasiliensis]|uniref:Uncharacterized protein n=1 Tax=Nippostrongylus brasiliensis TaxID=27835 RepID=A0A0N4Y6I7_NIPBR|nr:unnamed protein product [Nippostrongylus brasiliensis]